jgi:transcriptional regulator with XRE-family HTH domain
MGKSKLILLPRIQNILFEFGNNIKLARLRRKLSSEQVAERSGISRTTLWLIEKGSGSVAISQYIMVLFVLGLEKDMLKVASDDILGRKLQDADLMVKSRAPKKQESTKS